MENHELRNLVWEIVDLADIKTPKDALVLYSVSFLNDMSNKEKALALVRDHPKKMLLEQTDCGKQLEKLGFFSHPQDFDENLRQEIWRRFLERGIAEALGNLSVFVHGADVMGKFVDICVQAILSNDEILTINDTDKFDFIANKIVPKHRGIEIDVYRKRKLGVF